MDAFNSSNSPERDDGTSVHEGRPEHEGLPEHDGQPERPRVWSRSFGTGFVIAAALAAGCWAVIGWLVF